MNLTKSTKNSLVTIGMVVVAYIIMMILSNAGALSSLMKGLLVPLCIYAIIAVALNLTVGILGELSLGHAGFMCVGAFSSAFFSFVMKDTMAAGPRFLINSIIYLSVLYFLYYFTTYIFYLQVKFVVLHKT